MKTIRDVRAAAIPLLKDYGFNGAVIFGSYAKGSATDDSDLDILVDVAPETKTKKVFEFAYDLGDALGLQVDAYGTHEVSRDTDFYRHIMSEGIAI